MNVPCPKCKTQLPVPSTLMQTGVARATCSHCSFEFVIRLGAPASRREDDKESSTVQDIAGLKDSRASVATAGEIGEHSPKFIAEDTRTTIVVDEDMQQEIAAVESEREDGEALATVVTVTDADLPPATSEVQQSEAAAPGIEPAAGVARLQAAPGIEPAAGVARLQAVPGIEPAAGIARLQAAPGIEPAAGAVEGRGSGDRALARGAERPSTPAPPPAPAEPRRPVAGRGPLQPPQEHPSAVLAEAGSVTAAPLPQGAPVAPAAASLAPGQSVSAVPTVVDAEIPDEEPQPGGVSIASSAELGAEASVPAFAPGDPASFGRPAGYGAAEGGGRGRGLGCLGGLLLLAVGVLAIYVLYKNDWSLEAEDLGGMLSRAFGGEPASPYRGLELSQPIVNEIEMQSGRALVAEGIIRNKGPFAWRFIYVEALLQRHGKHVTRNEAPAGNTLKNEELARLTAESWSAKLNPAGSAGQNTRVGSGETIAYQVLLPRVPADYSPERYRVEISVSKAEKHDSP